MKQLYQGETFKLNVLVYESDGTTAATDVVSAFFVYKKNIVSTMKECVVTANSIEVKFTQAETKVMLGRYSLEVKYIDSAGEVYVAYVGALEIAISLMPDLVGA